MSFKNFSQLNDFIATTAEITDQLNSMVSVCQQGLTQLSSIKQISDAYARQYSLVQQIQYDADGNIQDVTSVDRLSVPNTVIDNAKDVINKCSLAIKRVKPVDLGRVITNLNITPIAKMYKYDNVNTNEAIQPSEIITCEDYYYSTGNSLYLSDEFINMITNNIEAAIWVANAIAADITLPTIVKIPYSLNGIPGSHQLAIINNRVRGVNERKMYVRHTGDFTKYAYLTDLHGRNLFDEKSYNLDYASIGGDIKLTSGGSGHGTYTLPNAYFSAPGDILQIEASDIAGSTILAGAS